MHFHLVQQVKIYQEEFLKQVVVVVCMVVSTVVVVVVVIVNVISCNWYLLYLLVVMYNVNHINIMQHKLVYEHTIDCHCCNHNVTQ